MQYTSTSKPLPLRPVSFQHPLPQARRLPTPVAPIAPPSSMPRKHVSLLGDVWNGAVRGDFARDLHLAGVVTQVALGYVPVVGSFCAARDLIADLRHKDHLGALLNLLAFTPFLGGFPKTAAAIHTAHHLGHAIHVVGHRQRDGQHEGVAHRQANAPQKPSALPPGR